VYFDGTEIIRRVCRADAVPFRPFLRYELGSNADHSELVHLVNKCWHPDPAVRPDFSLICAEFRAITRGK